MEVDAVTQLERILVTGAPNCDMCAETAGGRYQHERGNGHDLYECDTCGHWFIEVDDDE